MIPRYGAAGAYALPVRNQFAPGFDQLGTRARDLGRDRGATEWLYEQRAATMSLVATGGGLVFGGDSQRALPGLRRRDRRRAVRR